MDGTKSYFHGSIDRDEAVKRLQRANVDGGFLLRSSASSAGTYTISVQCGQTINHIRVTNTKKGGFAIGTSKKNYKTVWDMVDAHLGESLQSQGSGGAVGVSLKVPVENEGDILGGGGGGGGVSGDGMTEQEIAIKIMNGELPPDYEANAPRKSTVMSEEELMQKILDGDIDPDAADQHQVSKSAWRKQKGSGTKADARTAQAILDGNFDPDAGGPGDDLTEDEMMARIMDGDGPDGAADDNDDC